MVKEEKLIDRIRKEIREATLAKEEGKKEALKYLFSLLEKELLRKEELSSDEEVKIFQGEMKRKKEALDLFKKGKREDLVRQEEEEIKILAEFLPEEAGEEAIRAVVKKAMETEGKEFGRIMGKAMVELKGVADGATVSRIVMEEMEEKEEGEEVGGDSKKSINDDN